MYAILAPLSYLRLLRILIAGASNEVGDVGARRSSCTLTRPPPTGLSIVGQNRAPLRNWHLGPSNKVGNFPHELKHEVKQMAVSTEPIFELEKDMRVYNSLLQHVDNNLGLPASTTKRRAELSKQPVVQVSATHDLIVIAVNCRSVEPLFLVLLASWKLLVAQTS